MASLSLLSRIVAAALVLALFHQARSVQLPSAQPANAGICAERLARMDAVIQQSIEKHELPGAVVFVARRGRLVWRKAYGPRAVEPQSESMATNTIFDLASMPTTFS